MIIQQNSFRNSSLLKPLYAPEEQKKLKSYWRNNQLLKKIPKPTKTKFIPKIVIYGRQTEESWNKAIKKAFSSQTDLARQKNFDELSEPSDIENEQVLADIIFQDKEDRRLDLREQEKYEQVERETAYKMEKEKDIILRRCFHCHLQGHKKQHCPLLKQHKEELQKKQEKIKSLQTIIKERSKRKKEKRKRQKQRKKQAKEKKNQKQINQQKKNQKFKDIKLNNTIDYNTSSNSNLSIPVKNNYLGNIEYNKFHNNTSKYRKNNNYVYRKRKTNHNSTIQMEEVNHRSSDMVNINQIDENTRDKTRCYYGPSYYKHKYNKL